MESDTLDILRDHGNILWTCLAAFLVFFMQAGFALVEAGFTRAKNVCNIIMKNLMDISLGSIIFWLFGFGLLFGVSNGWVGTSFFLFDGASESAKELNSVGFNWAFLLFQTVFCATAATIVSGAVAERTKFIAYLAYSLVICGLIYPIFGSWAWGSLYSGSGWLETQVLKIRELAKRFNPDTIMIESNGYQRLVVHSASDLAGLPVEGHNTGREKHSQDVGIPGLALEFEKERYQIPWHKDIREASRPGPRKLTDGLSRLVYGKNGRLEGHTPDAVMALWMCELAIKGMNKRGLAFVGWDYI